MTSSYKEHQEEIASEQADLSYEDVREKMRTESDYLLELDNLPPIKHFWIDRGAKLTCENAGHTYHEAWKKL